MPTGFTIRTMPRQDGRRALITGGNSGIGLAAAVELARHGASVVLASRNQGRLDAAAAQLRREVPGSTIETSLLDLGSFPSIHRAAERELQHPEPLDLLILNAGVYCPPKRQTSDDGFELQWGTNVLGHFLLTGLLLPKLQRRAQQISLTGGLVQGEHAAPRIVTLSSVAHRRARLHWNDLQFEQRYSPLQAYAQSKLANLMFALELSRRLRAHNLPILSTAAHPGLADTNLFKGDHFNAFERTLRNLTGRFMSLAFNDAARGALPTLAAATDPAATPGSYWGPNQLFELRGPAATPAKISPQARDLADSTRLWHLCEDQTNLHYLD